MESFAPTLANEVLLCNEGVVPVNRFGQITVPTLALAGGASPAWADEAARAVAAAISNGQARVLDGQGHGVDDAMIAPVLTSFFL
jgi:pimeloyl-ACP methyl ester carboxylesterase